MRTLAETLADLIPFTTEDTAEVQAPASPAAAAERERNAAIVTLSAQAARTGVKIETLGAINAGVSVAALRDEVMAAAADRVESTWVHVADPSQPVGGSLLARAKAEAARTRAAHDAPVNAAPQGGGLVAKARAEAARMRAGR